MSKLELLKVNVDLGLISQAYGGLSIDDITASMTGSTESLRVERYVAMLLDGIQKEDQDKFDIITPHRQYKFIEIRNICSPKVPVNFAPSTATGKNRKFEEIAFYSKINAIDSYIFCDMRERFRVPAPLYEIPASLVEELYLEGFIGLDLHKRVPGGPVPHATLSQKKFFNRFSLEEFGLRG